MTLKHHRKFTREFKLQVLAEIAAGNPKLFKYLY
jgi:hypothetical protein